MPDFPANLEEATLVSAVLVVAPIACGVLAGRLARLLLRGLPARAGLVAIPALAVGVAPLLAAARRSGVSIYDGLLAAALFDVALLAVALGGGARRSPRGAWLLSLAVLAIGVGGLEWYARRCTAPTPWGLSSSLRLLFRPEDHDFGGSVLYAPVDGAMRNHHYANRPLPPPTAKVRVLHLGDSMLAATEVQTEACFTSLLERDRPGETDYNLGVDGVGPDFEYAMLARYGPAIAPTRIVSHVFPGNDVTDLDRPVPYCDGQTILTAGSSPTLRCPEPRWRTDLGEAFSFGPPPYPLRILARHSALAERLEERFERALSSGRHPLANDVDARLLRLRDILAATSALARSMHAPYQVVLLPTRPDFAWERFVPRERVVEMVRQAGVPFLDAQPTFDAAMAREPGKRWFQPRAGNPHMDVDGHALYARFLEEHVLAGAAPPP